MLYMHSFLFPHIKLSGPWKSKVFFMTICTLYFFAFTLCVVWITFTTLPIHLTSSANVFVMSRFLTPKTPQGSWYKFLYPLYRITNPDFFRYFRFIKGQYVCVRVHYFIVSSDGDSLILRCTFLLKCHFNFFWCCKWKFSTSYYAFRGIQSCVWIGFVFDFVKLNNL